MKRALIKQNGEIEGCNGAWRGGNEIHVPTEKKVERKNQAW